MGIQNIDSRVFFARRSKTRMYRPSLVITLCAILGLLGSLALATTTTLTLTNPNQGTVTTGATALSTTQNRTTGRSASPSTNTQTPILPFPTLLWQQIAALQSFDDGPSPYYTPQVLAILQQYKVKATFFCIGRQVARYPDLVRQEYNDGNLVGNHTWSHPNLALLSSSDILTQINLTADAIQQATGVRPTLFRPPYGVVNTRVLAKANLLGLTTIIWNDEARDWSTPGTGVIISRILNLAGDGAIILLHDGGGNRSQTLAALPTIIQTLRLRGFKFVTLQQMLNDLPKRPASTQAPVTVPTPASTP